MGEPGGVGPEIAAKAWRRVSSEGGPIFFLLGAPALLAGWDVAHREIDAPAAASAAFSDALPIIPLRNAVRAAPGHAVPENAPAVLESIERAVAYALSGEAAGVVTNPIQKSALAAAGFKFPGHTEYLADLARARAVGGGRTPGPVMMIAGPDLRAVPVTIHLSVKEAIASLAPDLIVRTGRVVAEALIEDFGLAHPRLVISGLNPHAGEAGALGAEDSMIIAPAIDRLREMGVDARGPLPADTMFHAEARATYDAALCMLHDQALIPAKTLAFHDAVNVTLGLPIVRTSPDHGTALDIAGKDAARPDSLIAAMRLASSIAARRRR